jgi:hypothetical protein
MKKIKITTCLCILVLMKVFSQPYGHFYYLHADSKLSSGTITTNSPGFLTAGFVSTISTLGNPNFNVTKILPGNAGIIFDAEYAMQGNGDCAASTNINNCAGITVIEENIPGGSNYALAGAYNEAAFFCMLTGAGAPYSVVQFPFPIGSSAPTKPIIIGGNTAGEYYITGSYLQSNGVVRRMYLLKVTSTGLLLSSGTYHLGSWGPLRPYDMILSPYNVYSNEEIATVGAAEENQYTGYNFNSHGFFATFNGNSLLNTSFHRYGQPPLNSNSQGERFECITVSNGTGGYAIGGSSNEFGFAKTCWAVNINAAGTNFNWNWSYDGALNVLDGNAFTGILERYSNFYAEYQYYAVVNRQTNNPDYITVYRLNYLGQAFLDVLATPNELSTFSYPSSTPLTPSEGVDIGFIDNGGVTDQGITLFGNDNVPAPGRHRIGKAAFNGWDDFFCFPTLSYNQELFNSAQIYSQGVVNLSGPSVCNLFNITVTYPTPLWNANVCNVSSLTLPANLHKGSNINGINSIDKKNESFYIAPNPANDYLNVNCFIEEGNSGDILISNALGQTVKSIHLQNKFGQQTLNIDLRNENLKSGIYFVALKTGSKIYNQKLIIND